MDPETNRFANMVLRSGYVIRGPDHNYKIPDGGFGKFIFDACDTFADKVCQICTETGESETFSSFKTRAVRVASHMKKLGIEKGDMILTCTPNTLDSALPPTACLFLGAISAALDPSLSVRDSVHLVSLAKPKIIFVCPNSVKLIEDTLSAVEDVDTLVVVFGDGGDFEDFEDFLEETGEEGDFCPEFLKDEDPSVMLFSSGTTGLPKGICLTQKSVYLGAQIFLDIVPNPEVMMHFTSFYWISAIIMYCAQFFRGSTRALINKFDPDTTFSKIAQYKVDSSFMASSYAYKISNVNDIRQYDLSALKCIIFGGGPIGSEQLIKVRKLLPETYCTVGYGMTELSGFGTAFGPSERELAYQCPKSCGRPIAGITLRVVDPETEKILGVNKPGEIRLKADSIMLGYFNQDTSSSYDAEGYLKTGDIGHFDENCCIYAYDRIKDMFKYQSWHIVPASIESVIMDHPDVADAAIFGIPHEEDENLPAAAIKLKPGSEATAEDIEKFVAERVLDRQRLRGGVFLVEDIPKTPSQKVLRRKVQQMILQRLENTTNI